MADLLNSEGIKITQQAISLYLRKYPILKSELNGKSILIKKQKNREAKLAKKEVIKEKVNLNAWKEQKNTIKKEDQKVLFDLNKPF